MFILFDEIPAQEAIKRYLLSDQKKSDLINLINELDFILEEEDDE